MSLLNRCYFMAFNKQATFLEKLMNSSMKIKHKMELLADTENVFHVNTATNVYIFFKVRSCQLHSNLRNDL